MEISIRTILAFIVVTILFAKFIWDKRAYYILSMKLPGPFSVPYFGSVKLGLEFMLSKNPLGVMWKAYEKYKGIFCGWVGPNFHIIVIEPEDIESLSGKITPGKYPGINNWWQTAMGRGLLTMPAVEEGSLWKKHKKIIHPTFSVAMNKQYYELTRKNCIILEEKFAKECHGGLIDVSLLIHRFCADSIMDSLYGINMHFQDGTRDEIFPAMEKMFSCIVQIGARFWLQNKLLYNISELGRRQKNATKIIWKLAKDVFDTKLQQANNNIRIDEYPEMAFLEMLIKEYKEGTMTEDEIIGEIMNIWCAAADTPSMGIIFAIMCLAMHKDCQDKAFKEIKRLYQNDNDAIINFKDLDDMPYLKMCVKEALRLFSPGPITTRYNTEEFIFKSKNLTIPPNTAFLILGFLNHRNPKYWDKPEEYFPERFSPEESAKRHPLCYIPFGFGPRKCAGRAYAKMLITVCMAHLLRKFEFHCDWKMNEIPLEFDFDVRSRWGYKVYVTHRKWN